MNKKLDIYLAGPRGFCAGVERAILMVQEAIKKYGAPVYVRHEIVHNKYVVDNLKSEGAIFVEELSEIDLKDRPVIFSAHGVPKSVPNEAENPANADPIQIQSNEPPPSSDTMTAMQLPTVTPANLPITQGGDNRQQNLQLASALNLFNKGGIVSAKKTI